MIRFKYSNFEYEVVDVLALYFESISNFVNKKINVDVCVKLVIFFFKA